MNSKSRLVSFNAIVRDVKTSFCDNDSYDCLNIFGKIHKDFYYF